MAEASLTMYDMAKQLAANDSPMDAIAFNRKMLEIAKDMYKCDYLMLLCNDRKDYTIFHIGEAAHSYQYEEESKLLAKDLSETINNRGLLIYADRQEDGVWEIWIRDTLTNENFAYYLFDYSGAVVEVGADE